MQGKCVYLTSAALCSKQVAGKGFSSWLLGGPPCPARWGEIRESQTLGGFPPGRSLFMPPPSCPSVPGWLFLTLTIYTACLHCFPSCLTADAAQLLVFLSCSVSEGTSWFRTASQLALLGSLSPGQGFRTHCRQSAHPSPWVLLLGVGRAQGTEEAAGGWQDPCTRSDDLATRRPWPFTLCEQLNLLGLGFLPYGRRW